MTIGSRPPVREEILARRTLKQETVAVPEWDCSVVVQELTAAERDDFEASALRGRGKKMEVNTVNLRAKLVARSVRAPDGTRLFNDGDVEALGQLAAAALDRVFTVAMRLSGLNPEDLEDLAGNSESGRSGSSSSGSPATSDAPTLMVSLES
jgi:hypothetical protein